MVIWLITESDRRRCRLPLSDTQDHVLTEGPCPACGALGELSLRGKDPHPSTDDRAYEAEARADCCKLAIGTLRTEVATLFGVREDMAVLHGRWRVY